MTPLHDDITKTQRHVDTLHREAKIHTLPAGDAITEGKNHTLPAGYAGKEGKNYTLLGSAGGGHSVFRPPAGVRVHNILLI